MFMGLFVNHKELTLDFAVSLASSFVSLRRSMEGMSPWVLDEHLHFIKRIHSPCCSHCPLLAA